MNKFAIPTILVATIMVAGMFAFVPVEQASTTHLLGTFNAAVIPDDTIVSADFDGAAGVVDTKLATISTDGKVAVGALDDDAGLVDIDFVTSAASNCLATCAIATTIDLAAGDKAICRATDATAADTVIEVIALDLVNNEVDVTTAANAGGDTVIDCLVLDLT